MNKINCFVPIKQGNMTYRFLPTGDIFTFTYDNFLINQFRGNVKDGSVNNIFLRIYDNETLNTYPLLGIRSKSKVSASENLIIYRGCIDGISYQVTFRPINNIWFWDITLTGTDKYIDLIYGQDIGIGDETSVYTNELYTSQYLGHSVFEGSNGYVICSRQNMQSPDSFPYIQQGSIGAKVIHYSTDGLQFFGLSYKDTDYPEALSANLQDYNLQYEFSYIALQTEKLYLKDKLSLSFYGIFMPSHPEAVKELEYQNIIKDANNNTDYSIEDAKAIDEVRIKDEFGFPYSSPSFTTTELYTLFPNRTLEEYQDEKLLSFFTSDHSHIVTKEKELLTDRPHGTIIMTPPETGDFGKPLIASTQYMYGIFNSHVVIGNTDMHKFLSSPRGFLNLLKNSGQRIYVKIEGKYRLLSMPALFEMGMNYSRWYYKFPDDTLIITAYTAVLTTDIILEVSSQKGHFYDYIITHQLSLGNNEYAHNIEYQIINDGLRFDCNTDAYPGLHYNLTIPGHSFSINNDRIFFENGTSYDETLLSITLDQNTDFKMIISGYMANEEVPYAKNHQFEVEKEAAQAIYRTLINQFHLNGSVEDHEKLDILNETVWWYAHNAMIHFAMPHGLEQPGGAAWGTRDICQGPMEFFLATQNYIIIKRILLNLFAHQDAITYEWPQWFMFDRYPLNAGECHGDVIFWPLKSVADYILSSGDINILNEFLPYHGAPDQKETILDHIKRAINNIKGSRIIKDTGLITYAGGDWDDTLQPAHEELKNKLISSWTEALAYQTFSTLAKALETVNSDLSKELLCLAETVKTAFHKILIKDGIIAGFLEYSDTYKYMLHPQDTTTGIHYRLLPMTRSIIAELAHKDQAKRNVTLIHEHLKCPDGVRLMDHPAHYDGGVSHLFKRAEQAANVGREISLQYTHAHIRYIEAMAKFGDGREAWNSLFTINPILIRHSVFNANIRQSNMYFSSSDGAYSDRYDYETNFSLLKTGDIKVKGGWRLYSSGPGIYFRQLVSNVLGIRFDSDGLIIDPVLPKELDNLSFTYRCFGRTLHFIFRISLENTLYATCNGKELPCVNLSNPYRSGGILINREYLPSNNNTITIYAKCLE